MRKLLLTLSVLAAVTVPLPDAPAPAAARAQAREASRVTLRIDGMTCGSCAAAVKVKLKRLDGVRQARVSFDDKRAQVVYDAQVVTPDRMIQAIEDLGYKARIAKEGGDE